MITVNLTFNGRTKLPDVLSIYSKKFKSGYFQLSVH